MSETPGNELRPRAQSRGELRERSSTVNATRLPGIARHGRLPKSKPWATVLKFFAASLAVLLVSGAAIGSVALGSLVNKATDDQVILVQPADAPPPQIGALEGGFNILVVGSDARAGQGGIGGSEEDETGVLNDVNILLHVAADRSSATAISFPRDMVVGIPECPWEDGSGTKAYSTEALNTAMYYGGLNCVAMTLSSLTGLPIQYAATIEFYGVINMSDAIGGVDVCFDGPIDDPNTGLVIPAAGVHNLKGVDALAFLRTRYGVGDGSDLTRISSQQVYLSGLVRKLKDDGTLTNPATVYNLASTAFDNLKMSSTLANIPTMVSMGLALKDVPLERVTFVQYPGTTGGSGIYEGKVQPNTYVGDELMALIAADQPFALEAAGDGSGSIVDPNAPAVDPAAPVEDVPVVAGVTGQTAADYTCSVSNDY